MITGNKSEWSEIYTLFKLLGDKELQSGNEDFEKIENLVYPILKILRSETNGDFQYSIEDDIVLISGSDEVLIKQKIMPKIDINSITWVGEGKKTVDVQGIKERFTSLGIKVDWSRLKDAQD